MLPGKRLYPYVERVVEESTGLLRFFQGCQPKTPYPVRHSSGMDVARAAVWAQLHLIVTKAAFCDVEGAIGSKAGIPGGEMAV